MAKTEAEVNNINARCDIGKARTRMAIGNAVDRHLQLGELERGTLDRIIEAAWSLGWSAGADDATRDD